MKRLCVLVCILLTISTSSLPLLGSEVDSGRAEFVRTGMTIAGAAIGLVTGASIGLSFSQNAIETPLSDTLLLTIPVAAAGARYGIKPRHCLRSSTERGWDSSAAPLSVPSRSPSTSPSRSRSWRFRKDSGGIHRSPRSRWPSSPAGSGVASSVPSPAPPSFRPSAY